MKKRTFINILLSFGPVLLVAGLGSLFVFLGTDWFNSLFKPSQWIPNIIIPIVWTVIYSTTGIVIYLWISKDVMPKSVLWLFIINGILNVAWCLLFFTFHLTFVGLIAIVINVIFGFFLLFEIRKFKLYYFYALLIYPIWLSIATCLNIAIWILN